MIYQKITSQGKWAKASELVSGSGAKILSETISQPSSFLNKDGSPKVQDVCKVQFQGLPEPLNVSLNRATINGLVDAFGEDSKKWVGHPLIVETEKMRVAGKAVVAMYLIPEGFKRIDDENGYALIVNANKIGGDLPEINVDEDISPEDLPI
jgi:hypothetical protein